MQRWILSSLLLVLATSLPLLAFRHPASLPFAATSAQTVQPTRHMLSVKQLIATLATLALKPIPSLGALVVDEPEDAIAREFVVFKSSSFNDEPIDADAREFVLFKGDGPSGAATDAIAREFVLFKGDAPSGAVTDAIAREFVLFKGDAPSSAATDAIAREFVLFKNTDASSIPTDAIAREFVVEVRDTTPPISIITVGPRDGGQVPPGTAMFQWVGSDNTTPPAQLQFQHRLDLGEWSAWSSSTQHTTPSLGIGKHRFEVRAKDLEGNIQTVPALRRFAVDITPPVVTELGVKDINWNQVTIFWRTNELAKGTVQYGLQSTNDFRFSKPSEPILSTYHEVVLKGLSSKTPYHFKVDLLDEANNATTSETRNFTTALLYDLSVEPTDISFSIPFPANNDSITMSARVHNTGDVALVGNVDFYDYRTDTGAVLLGTQTVTLQPYTAPTTVTSPNFTVRERVHKPFVAVRVDRDDRPENNRADKNLFVNAQQFRLTYELPTIQTWPADIQQFTIVIQNTGSASQTISDARAQGISFVSRISPLPTEPLAPGETKEVTFQLNTPAGQAPGTLAGEIIVVGAEQYRRPLTVVVNPAPVAQLQVRLVNDRTNQGIVNGIVVIGNDPRTYTTGPDGYVATPSGTPLTVAVPLGNTVVHGYAQEYLPKSGCVQIVSGSNALTIELDEGNALEITQIETRPLTAEEIAERGVNLQDPVNYWVYDFTIYMQVDSIPIRNIVAPRPRTGGGGGGGGYSQTFNGIGNGNGNGRKFKLDWYFDENSSSLIMIPGEVRILKQFWDATVTIENRTSNYQIHAAEATISLPNGLGLPALFGSPQATTKSLGTIPPRESRQAIWTIRGDIPGEYRFTGRSTGNLMLGALPVPVDATLRSGLIEVASPNIEITFTTPNSVTANEIFELGVHVRNTSSVDLEFVQVSLRPDKLRYCELVSAATVILGQIQKNDTKTAWFSIRSLVTGVVRNDYIIVSPPPAEPPVEIIPGRMEVLSVDDSDPRSPVITFECSDADAVVARIAGRTYNLGALTEGTHEVELTNLHTVAPGLYQLEIDGLFNGAHLIDSATFDSRLIEAPLVTGTTPFTVNSVAHSLQYDAKLKVRRWQWNIPGEDYTRFIVGGTANLRTTLTAPNSRANLPSVNLLPPTSNAFGIGSAFAVEETTQRGRPLSWSCRNSAASFFADPTAQARVRIASNYQGHPWLFGGIGAFEFLVPVP